MCLATFTSQKPFLRFFLNPVLLRHSLRVHVRMCVRICVFVHICIYAYIYTYICTYVCVYVCLLNLESRARSQAAPLQQTTGIFAKRQILNPKPPIP